MEGINSYIAIDVETTGLDPKQDKVIEIGALRVFHGQIIEEFQSLINPERTLMEHTCRLTGITNQMVSQAPTMDQILPCFMDFLGTESWPLLGHHVIFDFSFLKRAAVNRGFEFKYSGIDTLSLCRRFMPEEERKNLEAACSFYGIIRRESHRALADARDAHELYQVLRLRHQMSELEVFTSNPLIYKVKREQPGSKREKEDLRYLTKYHKIELPMQIDSLSRNEISRIRDKIILQYGKIKKR